MKQKKIFTRKTERHPLKWALVAVGLASLSFMSFSAGVQFGQLELDDTNLAFADNEGDESLAKAAEEGSTHLRRQVLEETDL